MLRAGATGLNGTGCNLVFWGQEEQSREPGLVRLEKMLRTGWSLFCSSGHGSGHKCFLGAEAERGFVFVQSWDVIPHSDLPGGG